MITAFVCVCGLAVLEMWLIIVMAIWNGRIMKEVHDLESPLFPIEVDDDEGS